MNLRRSILVVLLLVGYAAFWARGLAEPQAKPTTRPVDRMVQAASKAYTAYGQLRERGQPVLEDMYVWSRRWMEASRDAAATDAQRRAAMQAHRDRIAELSASCEALFQAGHGQYLDVIKFQYYLAEAEHELEAR